MSEATVDGTRADQSPRVGNEAAVAQRLLKSCAAIVTRQCG